MNPPPPASKSRHFPLRHRTRTGHH